MPIIQMKNKKILFYLIIFITLILILIFAFFLIKYFYTPVSKSSLQLPNNYVINIIDGDTFEIASWEKVRLLCIDAPEKNQRGYEESKSFLESLIINKEVIFEKDVSEIDKYGRLLRYVYVNDSNNNEIFVNKELVSQGYAEVFPFGDDVLRCGEIGGVD